MLPLKIAFRYLRAKKSHTAVNVITLIAVVGVAIATMAMVLVLSIFNGFSDLALSQLSSLDPQLSLTAAKSRVIVNADSLARAIARIPGVASAAPAVEGRALLVDENIRIPVIFKGVASGFDSASGIDDIMLAGQYAEYTTDGTPAAQLSVGVANRLITRPAPDSYLELYVPRRKGRINPANPAASFRSASLAFSGVFRVSNSDIDNDHIIIPLDAARDILDYDTEASSVDIMLSPDASESVVTKQIKSLVGDGYKISGRLEQRADSFKMISVEKWVTFMMLVCILVITLFNVVSTLSLLAIEKRDNMQTLRALGAPPSLVRNVFIAEGFLVTVVGGAIGIVAGLAVALVQQVFHVVGLSADASTLTIDYYPVRVEAADILVVAAVILAVAVVVGAIGRLIVKRH